MIDRTVTPGSLAGLLGKWQPGGAAYLQLAGGIRRLVADGRLPMQSRLPAERHLALTLGVSRNTVTAAYELLRQEGFVASRQGSGTWTTLPDQPSAPGPLRDAPIDLTVAAMSAPPGLAACARRAVDQLEQWSGAHGYEPLGLPVLRAAIASHLSAQGLATTESQVLVTNGAMQAVDLVFRALGRRGDTALVELPTYPSALDAMRAAGLRTAPVPVSAAGWDVELLQSTFRRARPQLAYLVPDFQNPTGALVNAEERAAMLRAAMRVDCHVLIDQTFVDLSFQPRAMPPLTAAIVDDPRVLTLGSMSKAFWGGLRIGWVRATPTMVQRLARVRSGQDMASPVLEQLVSAELLRAPARILSAQRQRAERRLDALTTALRQHLPRWRWVRPAGGLSLWVELPEPGSETLAALALREGVRLAPGSRFGTPGVLDRFVRLPFSLPEARLEDAVERLARAAASGEVAAARRGPAYVA
jgi:DNA-binding transcriptional MocR family regulator